MITYLYFFIVPYLQIQSFTFNPRHAAVCKFHMKWFYKLWLVTTVVITEQKTKLKMVTEYLNA